MTTTIPRRHPTSPRKVPGLEPFALLLGLRKPDPARWRELGAALTVGDPPADALVEWMYANDMAVTRPLFDRALHEGIESLPDPPEPLGPGAMRRLGLPVHLPWYPVLRIPVNLARDAAARLLPGGERRAAVRGRRKQEAFLTTLQGPAGATIGKSAAYLGNAA